MVFLWWKSDLSSSSIDPCLGGNGRVSLFLSLSALFPHFLIHSLRPNCTSESDFSFHFYFQIINLRLEMKCQNGSEEVELNRIENHLNGSASKIKELVRKHTRLNLLSE